MAAKTKSELIAIATRELENLDKLCAAIDAQSAMKKREEDT